MKTVDKIQRKFTTMIQDLDKIVAQQEHRAEVLEKNLKEAKQESDKAYKFSTNLRKLVGDDE